MKLFPLLILFFAFFIEAQEKKTYDQAKVLYQNGSYQESIDLLNPEVKSGNVDYDTYVLLANNYWQLGDTKTSIDFLYSALKLNSNIPEVYIELIKAYTSSEKYKGALEISQKALEKFPDHQFLKMQHAILLGKLGKVLTALRFVEELKTASPNDPRPLGIESHLYTLQGDYEKAEMSLKWALSLDPLNPFYKNNLALIYEKLSEKSKKPETAKKYLEDALEMINEAVSTRQNQKFLNNQIRIKEKLSKV